MVIPFKSDSFILYNTLQDTILVIDSELLHALERCEIPEEYCTALKSTGMIVEEGIQEDLLYQFLHHSQKYGTSVTYFTVLPTYACNLQCPYCYEKAGTVLSTSMSEKTAEEVSLFLRKMAKKNRSNVVLLKFYGGEPLLNKEAIFTIYDSLSEVAQKNNVGFYIVLQTNGTLLTEQVIEKLKPHLWTVEVTLEGDMDLHDTIRVYKKGGGTYQDILRAVDLLLKKGVHTAVRINASQAEHLDILLQDMKARGLNQDNLSFYITQTSDFGLDSFFTDDILCLQDERKSVALIPELRKVVDKNGFTPNLTVYDTVQRKKVLPCNSEKAGNYVVDPFGDIYLCFFTAGKKEFCAGTIGPKGEVTWNPQFYEVMARNPVEFAECRTCKLLPMCGGGCHIRAYQKEGTYQAPHCGTTKEMAEERIKLYLRQKYPERFGGL